MTPDGRGDSMALCKSCRHIHRNRCDMGMATLSSVTDSTICGMYDFNKDPGTDRTQINFPKEAYFRRYRADLSYVPEGDLA